MTEKIIEIRTRMVEPVCIPDYSDYERRLQYIELRGRMLELRYNHNHDEKGRFCSGGGGRISSVSEKKLYSNGGANPEKNLDKSEKSGIIEETQSYNFDPKVKPDVRDAFNEEYAKSVEKYGKITTISGVDVLYTKSTDEGSYNDNSRRIELRHADKKDGLKKMASVAQEKYKAGQWSTGNPRHAIRHEIGHAIQLEHKLNDTQWNDKLSKINGILDKSLKGTDSYSLPSKYSGDELPEFISECIAASYSKKQSKTVRDVSQIIIRSE